jgi:hypothetical protein
MKSKFVLPFAFLLTMFLAACGGGGDGPTLGAFPAISKAEGDAAFTLTAPTSKGPGAFTFTSSNAEVATISGNTVTIVGAGTSTITAQQAASGSYNASSTSAILTVTPKPCIAPATRENNVCTAPATSATIVTSGSHTWMPVTFADNWANANSFCTTTTINGSKGWRLPTEIELTDLRSSGAIAGHGWSLSRTWSSTIGTLPARRKGVRLDDGIVSDDDVSNSSYVACVK